MGITRNITAVNSTKNYRQAAPTGITASQQSAVDFYANIVIAEYLIVAGGGSGGAAQGTTAGGGGAGQILNGNIILIKGVTHTIVIGGGGSATLSVGNGSPGGISLMSYGEQQIAAFGGGGGWVNER
jgi:hypothetical protein